MLLSLSLKNWRSHADTRLEFGKGTNLLIGIMGSGKSSVLDGVCFALFGTFPSLERRKQSLTDLFRLNENHASVKLEFKWNGSIYLIERKLEKKKDSATTDAEIYKDNKLAEKGTTAVTDYISRLLSLDYDLFTRAIYSEQNNIDYFLTLDPRKRKQEMDVLLGLDKFEDARINCTSLVNRVKAERKALEMKFTKSALEETQAKEKTLADRAVAAANAEKEATESTAKAKTTVAAAESAFSQLKKAKEQHFLLERERLRLETTLINLKKELDGKHISEDEVAKANARKKELETEKAAIAAEIKLLDAELSKLNLTLGSLETKLKNAEKDKAEAEAFKKRAATLANGRSKEAFAAECDALADKIQKLDAEIRFIDSRLNELTAATKHLKPGMAKCPVCNGSMEGHSIEKLVAEKKEETTKLEVRKKEAAQELTTAKPKLTELQSNLKNLELVLAKIDDLEKRIVAAADVTGELTEARKNAAIHITRKNEFNTRLDASATELQRLLLNIRESEQLLKKKTDFTVADTALISVKEKLFALSFDEAAFEQQQKELETLRLNAAKLEAEMRRFSGERKAAEDMRALVATELQRLLATETEISALYKLEEELVIYKNALASAQLNLRTDLVESINTAMNEIWSIFYPYRDYREIRLLATDKDYHFEVKGADWRALETVASGGERACAALTLRVALAMVLTPNLSWLILDEPTHNLDKEAVELLSQTLQLKVPEVIDQTFVITHEEGLMGSDFASSYKLSRDKGKFEATRVEKI
jgi:exonuclease SbcC